MSIEVMNDQQAAKAAGGRGRAHGQMEDSLGLLRSFISPESVRLFGIASSGLSASSTEVTFQKVLERDADEEVISMSHFLPEPVLLPEKRFLFFPQLAEAAGPTGTAVAGPSYNISTGTGAVKGSANLDSQDGVLTVLHLFGHTHFAWDQDFQERRYVSAPLGSPKEWRMRPRSMKLQGGARATRKDGRKEMWERSQLCFGAGLTETRSTRSPVNTEGNAGGHRRSDAATGRHWQSEVTPSEMKGQAPEPEPDQREPDAVPPAVPVAPYVRVIHQQYRTAHADAWPPEWRRLSGFWQRAAAHGRWRWRFWTDEEEAKLFKEELPELEEFYHWIPQCLDAKISQADLSTYAILYVHGGVYADMDTMPVGSLDAFLDAVSSDATGERPLAVLASISRPDEEDIRGRGGFLEPYGVDTDLMISTAPRHPFFLEALLSIRRYLQTHNATVCGRDRRTPTYDLMFLTAWGRLSMLARAWTAEGLNQSRLTFLESLFLREPYEASHVHLVLHVLANLSLEELVAHPPPRHELRLERWLAKRLERSTKRSRPHGHATDLSPPILRVAPDLLLAPIAQSPAVEKRQLRQWHLIPNTTWC
ncbi:unnamed protein product [Durusdinium trenchii]|uniref:Uncharacterized protein n=1 Tax=Durusdinium trenchii TaxID=1381693 RepID=A0ABP0KDA1_9DINO